MFFVPLKLRELMVGLQKENAVRIVAFQAGRTNQKIDGMIRLLIVLRLGVDELMEYYAAARATVQRAEPLELVEVSQIAVQVAGHDQLPGPPELEQRTLTVGIVPIELRRLVQPACR